MIIYEPYLINPRLVYEIRPPLLWQVLPLFPHEESPLKVFLDSLCPLVERPLDERPVFAHPLDRAVGEEPLAVEGPEPPQAGVAQTDDLHRAPVAGGGRIAAVTGTVTRTHLVHPEEGGEQLSHSYILSRFLMFVAIFFDGSSPRPAVVDVAPKDEPRVQVYPDLVGEPPLFHVLVNARPCVSLSEAQPLKVALEGLLDHVLKGLEEKGIPVIVG